MRGGHLRHRITLQQPTRTDTDGDGHLLTTFTTVATLSANVRISGGSEDLEHRQKRGSIDALVELRYSPTTAAIRADWRFLFNGQTFEITAPPVDLDGNRQMITLEAQAKPGLD